MKKLFLIAGAAALGIAGQAAAKPGHGGGHGRDHGMKASKASRGVVMSDQYGRLYALNSRGTCPPGLDKRGNGCMPPGQAKRSYRVGQRYNRNFGTAWTYNQIPDYLRSQYTINPNYNYYYNNGYLYQVNPRTMVIDQVISALLR